VRFINFIFIFHMMLVILYAVIREKGKGVPWCMGCFSFSCAFGSYFRLSCSVFVQKKPKKPKKFLLKNLGFFQPWLIADFVEIFVAQNCRRQWRSENSGCGTTTCSCVSNTSVATWRNSMDLGVAGPTTNDRRRCFLDVTFTCNA